jgi:hypothetical protein
MMAMNAPPDGRQLATILALLIGLTDIMFAMVGLYTVAVLLGGAAVLISPRVGLVVFLMAFVTGLGDNPGRLIFLAATVLIAYAAVTQPVPEPER